MTRTQLEFSCLLEEDFCESIRHFTLAIRRRRSL